MKATGIVRRIDDLGRIVIPKEIRQSQKIREGDPLEIYVDKKGGVTFKKYSPMGYNEDVVKIAMRMATLSSIQIAIYDADFRIAGNEKFPKTVAHQWGELHEDGATDKYYIYPIDVKGGRLGYVVSSCGGADVEMIKRYLIASFED